MPGRPLQESDYGLKVLVDPKDADIDVVAIHGTGAHPDDTWCQKRAPDLPVADPASYIYWLKDLLPAVLPRARVMRFGYASAWFGPSMILTSATEISRDLLELLDRAKVERRPLIILAHSFGGVVVMRMVRDTYEDYPDLHNSIAGMVFFGTPFRGSDTTTQETLLRLAHENHGRVERGQIENMGAGSYLDGVLSDFLNTLKRLPMPRVLCIYEQVQTQVASVISKEGESYSFWVNRKSATLDVAEMIDQRGRRCDHLRLNKYAPGDEWTALSRALKVMADEAPEKITERRRRRRQMLDESSVGMRSIAHPSPGAAAMVSVDPIKVARQMVASNESDRLSRQQASLRASYQDATGLRSAQQKSPRPSLRSPCPELPITLTGQPPSTSSPWDNPAWFDTMLDSKLTRWDYAYFSADRLFREHLQLTSSTFHATVQYRSAPFDEDLLHSWHFARVSKSRQRFCLKISKTKLYDTEGLRASYLAKMLALDFSERLTETVLDFQTQVLLESGGRFFTLMHLLGEELIDYDHAVPNTSTTNYWHAGVCRAFSHYTHLMSDRQSVVSSLRGKDLMLGPPVIEDAKPFLARHLCNDYCRRLGISTSAERAQFKKEWPRGRVAICNNKMCRRLVRRTTQSVVVDGITYGFCSLCAPQIALYNKKQTCRRCGREMKAESEFWYAARGLPVPDLCAEHSQERV